MVQIWGSTQGQCVASPAYFRVVDVEDGLASRLGRGDDLLHRNLAGELQIEGNTRTVLPPLAK